MISSSVIQRVCELVAVCNAINIPRRMLVIINGKRHVLCQCRVDEKLLIDAIILADALGQELNSG